MKRPHITEDGFFAKLTNHTASGSGWQYSFIKVAKDEIGYGKWLAVGGDDAVTDVAYNTAEDATGGTALPNDTIVYVCIQRVAEDYEYWFIPPAAGSGKISYATKTGVSLVDGWNEITDMDCCDADGTATDGTVTVYVFQQGGQIKVNCDTLIVGYISDGTVNRSVWVNKQDIYFYTSPA